MPAKTSPAASLLAFLLGCAAPVMRPMTIYETGPDGKDRTRMTEIGMKCGSCPACMSETAHTI